jgi:hypothetical protein
LARQRITSVLSLTTKQVPAGKFKEYKLAKSNLIITFNAPYDAGFRQYFRSIIDCLEKISTSGIDLKLIAF